MSAIAWGEFSSVVCQHLGTEDSEISMDTNIYEDIGIDSLGVMTLGAKLQKSFQVRVPLSSVSSITTLGQMLDVLNQHRER